MSTPEEQNNRPTPEYYGADNSVLKKEKISWFWETIRFAFIAAIFVIPIRIYVASPFIVSGASMDPTFETGHYLIIDQLSYKFHEPERGDVVVFRYPNDPDKFFIKRIVGLPGETVSWNNGVTTIQNETHPNGILLSEEFVTHSSRDSGRTTLDADEYFVLGDNRAASLDSRIWGPLDESFITGRAFVRILPPQKADLFPGKVVYPK